MKHYSVQGLGCLSVAECLPGVSEVLFLNPQHHSSEKKEKDNCKIS